MASAAASETTPRMPTNARKKTCRQGGAGSRRASLRLQPERQLTKILLKNQCQIHPCAMDVKYIGQATHVALNTEKRMGDPSARQRGAFQMSVEGRPETPAAPEGVEAPAEAALLPESVPLVAKCRPSALVGQNELIA
jgi:hypothetical protein